MKPSDLKQIVGKLKALGFEASIEPGPVDRASRPMSLKLDVKVRDLSIDERQAFVKFFAEKTK